jgi:hypothetical protein
MQHVVSYHCAQGEGADWAAEQWERGEVHRPALSPAARVECFTSPPRNDVVRDLQTGCGYYGHQGPVITWGDNHF